MTRRKFWKSHTFVAIYVLSAMILLKFMPKIKRGFWCGDPMISHKYTGDTYSGRLLLESVLAPVVFILIAEWILLDPEDYVDVSAFKVVYKRSFHVIKNYLSGAIFNAITIELMKNLFSENRPQFLDTCRPDAAVNCRIGEFIKDYECTNSEYRYILVRESNHSFPSGHTALIVYVSLFMIWYLQHRYKQCQRQYCVKLVQVAFVVLAIFCSISRIIDKRHFWWDVLGGLGLGLFMTHYTGKYLCKNFLICDCHTSRSFCHYHEKTVPDSSQKQID